MQTERIFTCSNNTKIHAICWGDSHHPTLLALHGWLDNADSFHYLAPLLTHYHVITSDLPGHGQSSHLVSSFDYMMANQLIWLHDLVQQLANPNLSLLGHSMGAGIASLYAACFPQMIDCFITLDMLGPLSREANQTIHGLKQSVLSINKMHQPPKQYNNISTMIQRRATLNGLTPESITPMVHRGVKRTEMGYQWSFDPKLLLTSPTVFTEVQIHDVLSHITCPTLAIMAQNIENEQRQNITNQRFQSLPNATLKTVNACHHLHLSHPNQTAQIIDDWHKYKNTGITSK